MTPDEIDAFIRRFTDRLPRLADRVQTGPQLSLSQPPCRSLADTVDQEE